MIEGHEPTVNEMYNCMLDHTIEGMIEDIRISDSGYHGISLSDGEVKFVNSELEEMVELYVKGSNDIPQGEAGKKVVVIQLLGRMVRGLHG